MTSTYDTTAQPAQTEPGPLASQTRDRAKSGLRGMDFEAGSKALMPPDDRGHPTLPLQMKVAAGTPGASAIVQRDSESAPAGGDDEMFDPAKHMLPPKSAPAEGGGDDEMFDPAKHMLPLKSAPAEGGGDDEMFDPARHMLPLKSAPAATNPFLAEGDGERFDPAEHGSALVMTGDPAQKAKELKPEIEAQNQSARDARAPLAKELAAIEEALPKLEGEEKAKAEAKKKEVAERLKPIERTIQQTGKDLETLAGPGDDAAKYNDILARQKAFARTDSVVEVDRQGLNTTTTSTGYNQGTATTTVKESKAKVDGDGLSQTDSRRTDEVSAGGRSSSSVTAVSTIGKDGLGFASSTKQEQEDNQGQATSSEKKSNTKLGPAGVSQTDTEITTAADGSSSTRTTATGITRGDGKLGVSSSDTEKKKDAAGDEVSSSGATKAGLIAGKDGVGGFADREESVENKRANGIKTGAVAGLNGNVVCNVEEVPKSDPKKYRLTLSVNLGLKLAGSAGYEKDPASVKGGASVSVKGGASVAGEGNVSMSVAKTLTEDEAKAYLENLKAASAGGSGGGGKEMAVIQTGVTKGWEAAQRLYQGAKAGVTDPTALEHMQDGDRVELGSEGKLGVSGNLGAEGGGLNAGIKGGYEVSRGSKMAVEKQGGKYVYTPSETESEKITGGGTVGGGVVKGGMSGGLTDRSGTGYKFTLDPKDPQFAEMQAALAACDGQGDLDAFAKRYPSAVGEKTKSSGKENTLGATLGIGPAEVGLNTGSSYDEKTITDAEGKLKSKEMVGANTSGMTVKVGGLQVGASSRESVVAEVDAAGKASVDVGQKDTSTDAAKWLEANVPLAGGEKKDQGELSKLTGGGEKPNTDTQRIEGMKLDDGDLEGLGALAMDQTKWSAACPIPRLRPDWLAAGARIRAAGGSPAVVAAALAKFGGGSGPGRDDVVYQAMRDPGDVRGGNRYEFPESLLSSKPTYDALVAGDPVAAMTETEAKDGNGKAKALGTATLGKLESLYNQVSSARGFEQPAAQSEMLAAISRRQGEVRGRMRVLNGGKADELTNDELHAKYNALLDNCVRHQGTESDCFAAIDGDDDAIAKAKLIKQVRDLHAIWGKDYNEMAALAQEHGFGQDRYWKFKPDTARFKRALSGPAGAASEPQPETEDKRKKTLTAPKDPIGEANADLAMKQATLAEGISGRMYQSKDRAYGSSNRLHAWIESGAKPKAIDAHNRGAAKLRAGDRQAAGLPKDPTADLWATNGLFAAQDYESAAEIFQEGLELYPAGWPPKV